LLRAASAGRENWYCDVLMCDELPGGFGPVRCVFVDDCNVFGVAGRRGDSVSFDRAGVVAEGLGDNRHGREPAELFEGAESGSACAERPSESVPHARGIQVPAGGTAAKYPVAVGVCGCLVMFG
jgi:hypothetical protein